MAGQTSLAKKFHSVHVRLPIHGADESDERRRFRRVATRCFRIRRVLRQIDSGRNDGNAIAIHPLHHERAIILRDRNHMLKSTHRAPLVTQHLAKFHAVYHLFGWVACGFGMTPPNFTLHVVLEQHARNVQTSWKIHCRIQKIAHRNVKAPLAEPCPKLLLHSFIRKTADRVGWLCTDMPEIVEAARRARQFLLTGTHGNGSGQLPLQLALVVRVRLSSIVGVERQLMPQRQISQHVIGADIATVLHGQEFVGLHPEDSHSVSEPRPPSFR